AATTINCPIGTVRSRVARARTTLITLLTDTTPQAVPPAAVPPAAVPHRNRVDRTAPKARLAASPL
ncbi:RNA polymerase subunit sigma-24, partial [Streptomyces sp. NPDC002044]